MKGKDGGMEVSQARKLKVLEENDPLKRMLMDAVLKWRRQIWCGLPFTKAVEQAYRRFGISERRGRL